MLQSECCGVRLRVSWAVDHEAGFDAAAARHAVPGGGEIDTARPYDLTFQTQRRPSLFKKRDACRRNPNNRAGVHMIDRDKSTIVRVLPDRESGA